MNRLEELAKIAYSHTATVYHTYKCAFKCPSEGLLVECGVGAGAQIGAMLMTGRQVIGFDSFEGIPMAGPHDTTQPGIGEHNGSGALVSSGIASHSPDNVISNLLKAGINTDSLTLVKGWFQHTVPEFRGKIALLRLDGDLYESTRVCLEHLLPQVVKGGIVIIDDYALDGCRKACDEYGLSGEIVDGSGGVMWFVKQ